MRQGISIKAELEEISNIYPQLDKTWFVTLTCSNCGEVTPNMVSIDPCTQIEIVKATVNFAMKCKLCRRENSVSIETADKQIKDRTIESEQWVQMATFDLRGFEIKDVEFGENWSIVIPSGKTYSDVDLSTGEWSEYDEGSSTSISILNMEYKVDKLK
ncbi:DUF866 family protein [Tieghemostelium lacteum]|uniref:DUF866 family protein n=1 Tax=Tieghemostelium lacteum TaxID=361077 RepID=A0A151ZG78_TIELA|nr:DUF866 family protein [Tieghemostelium lacteum]|eukprot:KYQ92919.1 DUF866 family protein [Tieghemostelium lacteum]